MPGNPLATSLAEVSLPIANCICQACDGVANMSHLHEWHPSSNEERGLPLPVCTLFCAQLEPAVCSRCDRQAWNTAQLYGVHFLAGSAHQVLVEENESLWKYAQRYHLVRWWVYSVCLSNARDCLPLCHQQHPEQLPGPRVHAWSHPPNKPMMNKLLKGSNGLLMQMETFNTLFILKLAYLNFSAVKQFFTNVQAKDTTVNQRCSAPQSVLHLTGE